MMKLCPFRPKRLSSFRPKRRSGLGPKRRSALNSGIKTCDEMPACRQRGRCPSGRRLYTVICRRAVSLSQRVIAVMESRGSRGGAINLITLITIRRRPGGAGFGASSKFRGGKATKLGTYTLHDFDVALTNLSEKIN